MVIADSSSENALSVQEGKVRVVLDLRVYRLTAIQKASYKFAREFAAVLGPMDGDLLSACFEFPQSTTGDDAKTQMRAFFIELLDQELRERIAEETHAIRSLILAQAFSKTDLIRRD